MKWVENDDRRRVLMVSREEWINEFDTIHNESGEEIVGERELRGGRRREVFAKFEGIEWAAVAVFRRHSDGKLFEVAPFWPRAGLRFYEPHSTYLCLVEKGGV